jgi:hypothetical protein
MRNAFLFRRQAPQRDKVPEELPTEFSGLTSRHRRIRMGASKTRLKRREVKAKVRAVWGETFAGLAPGDEAQRAARVRDLCPCEHTWEVPLWDIIFAACEDPSPLVRLEALHVIEDAHTRGFPTAHGMRLLFAAIDDPAPEVRRFVADVTRRLPKLRQARQQRPRRALPTEDDE